LSVDFVSAVASVQTLVGVPVAVALLLLLASPFMLDFHEGLRALFRAIFSSVKGAKRDSERFCLPRNGSELNSERFLDFVCTVLRPSDIPLRKVPLSTRARTQKPCTVSQLKYAFPNPV
jgi:hypothetical protein